MSPLLSNVYLTEGDRMLERAKAVTRSQQRTHVEYARFADDLVVLVDAHPRQRWLRTAAERRLRGESWRNFRSRSTRRRVGGGGFTRSESFRFLGLRFVGLAVG